MFTKINILLTWPPRHPPPVYPGTLLIRGKRLVITGPVRPDAIPATACRTESVPIDFIIKSETVAND